MGVMADELHTQDFAHELATDKSEVTHVPATSGDPEKVTTEQIQSQVAAGRQNQTNPVPDNLNRTTKCLNHILVCTTVSSLDKCHQCLGPVSSFKWLGYRCKVCSGVWHGSCLKQINDNFQHSSQEKESFKYSGNDLSSDEESSAPSESHEITDDLSDEDYSSNSETDDEDSDASIPLQSSQFKVGQIQGKTAISDPNIFDTSDTSFPNVPNTPKRCLPTHTNNIVEKTFKTSGQANSTTDSKDKPDSQDMLLKQESSNQITSVKNYCFVCGKPQSKISRHLKTHNTHAEIVYAFSLPEDSKERKILFEKMRNKGNFRHNTAVLQGERGPLKVKRNPKSKAVAGTFIHCMYCQGMYIRKELWRHIRRCPFKPEDLNLEKVPGRTRVLDLATANESAFCQQISSGVWKLFNGMKQDDVASVVRNDLSIIQFAHSLYNRHGQDTTKYEYMRQKLREVGRFLLCLRTQFSIHNLEEAVKPANFQRVVQAVKIVSGFDEERLSYQTPSLVLKLGHSLHKICNIIHCRALTAEDEQLIESTAAFKKLYSSQWSELVSHSALNTPSHAKCNKALTLPFTEDVQLLHQHLKKSGENAFCSFKDDVSPQTYAELAKVTLAQVIVFNRRQLAEVSKMHLKSFQEMDNTKFHEDVAMGLSKVEQKLCSHFSQVEIIGKGGRKVAVLLTPTVVDSLTLLASKREKCGVCPTNIYLFARPKSTSHYRGQDCLRVHASQCGAKHPEFLWSAQLRKHVATLSQVLNLKHNELDQVADFLDHDIRVNREFYMLPAPPIQLAKISKLLLSMEKGNLSNLQGKSLDEIEIEDEISLSDAEDVESENESDDHEAEVSAQECGNIVPVEAVTNCPITEQINDTDDEKNSRQTSTKMPKKRWSNAEVSAVMRYFRNHINKGKLASNRECSHCKQIEDPLLAQRTVQNIRDFVRNRGLAAKREKQKQNL